MTTTGLSPTVSEINGDFSPKSQRALWIFYPRWRGPPRIGYQRLGVKTRIVGLPGRERCLMISSAIWIQYSTRKWRTDGCTPADSKDRANAWRHAVKSIFAHARLYPVMASFKSKYGWTNSAELKFCIVPNQTRQLVSTYSLAKKILSNDGGARAHVPTSWRRHCFTPLPRSPPWTDFYRIWNIRSSRGRNQSWQKLCVNLLKDFYFTSG